MCEILSSKLFTMSFIFIHTKFTVAETAVIVWSLKIFITITSLCFRKLNSSGNFCHEGLQIMHIINHQPEVLKNVLLFSENIRRSHREECGNI